MGTETQGVALGSLPPALSAPGSTLHTSNSQFEMGARYRREFDY
jgi:hypothetical protein